MIVFREVYKSFGVGDGRIHALRGLSFQVPDGKMWALTGPSGAGKSTVLHLAAGLTRADAGEIQIGGRRVDRMTSDELTTMRLNDVGVVFQFFHLLPYLSAYDNVALPLKLDGTNGGDERLRVERALDLVEMKHRAVHRPHELSGGELQRIALARALVIEPTLILADEPTGNLDSEAGRQVMELLRSVNENTGLSILMVTHDPIWAAMCDTVIRIRDGQLEQEIPLEEACADLTDDIDPGSSAD